MLLLPRCGGVAGDAEVLLCDLAVCRHGDIAPSVTMSQCSSKDACRRVHQADKLHGDTLMQHILV